MDKNISLLVKEIQEATKWSQLKIAAELGTSQPTVNRILGGQTECMGGTFRKIQELHLRHCSRNAEATERRVAASG